MPRSKSTENSLNDLISGASKQAEEAAVAMVAASHSAGGTPQAADKPSENAAGEPVEGRKDKKDKSKASHLVYPDQETSPEEKMARMPRYAFTPEKAR